MKKIEYVILMIIFLVIIAMPVLAYDGVNKDGTNKKKKVKKTASVKKVVRKKPIKASGPKTDADYLRAGFKRVDSADIPPPIVRVRVAYNVTCSENKMAFLRLYLAEEFIKTTTTFRLNDLADYQKISVQSPNEFGTISKNIAKALMDTFGVDVVIVRDGYFLIEKLNLNLDANRLKSVLQLALLPFELFEAQAPVACGAATQVAKRQKIH